MTPTIRAFKWVSTLEAISYLILLFLGVPLKYGFENPQLVEIMGPIHGVLFVAYVVGAFMMMRKLNWTTKQLLIALFCSIIPFGPFYVERKYLPQPARS